MRVLVACLVVAAVIALPGVIVASTSNPSTSSVEYSSGGPIVEIPPATVRAGPVPTPIDPALLPTISAVTRALATKGIGLSLISHGADYTHFQQVGKVVGNCPVDIWIEDTTGGIVLARSDCGTGQVSKGKVRIVYSPPSIGSTVKKALSRH